MLKAASLLSVGVLLCVFFAPFFALRSGALSRKCMVGVAGKYSGCGGATDSDTMASTMCADGDDACVLVTVCCGQSLLRVRIPIRPPLPTSDAPFHLLLGGRRHSLARKPDIEGVKVLKIAVGADQTFSSVSLVKELPFDTWLQTDILSKESWGGVGGGGNLSWSSLLCAKAPRAKFR